MHTKRVSRSESESEDVHKDIEKVEKHIDKLEDKIEDKLEEQAEKMKRYDRKFNYKHLIRSLLCDKQIQFAGCAAYGTFFSQKQQTVMPLKSFVFDRKTTMKNFEFHENSKHIKVLISGVYLMNLSMLVEQDAQVCVYVNNKAYQKTFTASNKLLSCSFTLPLKRHDVLEIKNVNKTLPILTQVPVTSCDHLSQNLDLVLTRIAVLPELEYECDCRKNNKKNCSESSESSDSESSESESDNKSIESKKSCDDKKRKTQTRRRNKSFF